MARVKSRQPTKLRPAHNPALLFADALRYGGGLIVATIALMRCVILFAPQVVFDVDPVRQPLPLAGLGPAGSLWLDVALLLAGACALLGEWIARRKIRWALIALALTPFPIALAHGFTDADDLWMGSTWCSAALAAAVIAHLARDRALRIIIAMILFGVMGPLAVRGAANITAEHAANIAAFDAERETILREKGWEPDSANARIFERRLRQPQPIGWFITANIYASIIVVSLIVWIGCAIASARSKLPIGWTALAGLIALIAAGALWLTGAKGAQLAAFGGLVLLAVPMTNQRVRSLVVQRGGLIVIAIIVLALVGVLVRGTLLPEGFAGEKSLLFRWHYMTSSAEIIAAHPVMGVGLAGFQDAYMLHRHPRNPEEVASAHSMFLDWLATLGMAGGAWIALTLVLLTDAARGWRTMTVDEDVPHSGPTKRTAIIAVVFAALAGLLPAIMFESHALTEFAAQLRIGGVGAFLLASLSIGHIFIYSRAKIVSVTLIACAVVLVVHGQIEMTFASPGAAVWAMAVLGLAAGLREDAVLGIDRSRGVIGPVLCIGVTCAAAWIAITGAVPATQREQRMIAASRELLPLSQARQDGRTPPRSEIVERRATAADALVIAHDAQPTETRALLAAAEQLELAAQAATSPLQKRTLLDRARALIEPMVNDSIPAALNRAMWISIFRAAAATDEVERTAMLRDAIDFAQRLAERDPRGILSWVRLGDLHWNAGETEAAASAYRRALEANDNFALDPLKQLPARRKQEIERRRGRQ